jgi:hypothetical protein
MTVSVVYRDEKWTRRARQIGLPVVCKMRPDRYQ